MRADGTEFPVELVVTRPEIPGAAGLLRLPARPDRALRRRGLAAPAGRRAGGAAAGGDGGGGRARPDAAVRAGQRGGRAAAGGADRAHVPLRPRRRGRARSSAAGRCGPSTCCRPARACRSTATRRRRACGAPGRPARMDTYEGAEGELAATHARLRRAGRGRRADLPRRVAVGRGGRLLDGPASRSRRTPSSGSPTSPSWPRRRWPTRRRARSSPRRAPASSPRATPSAGGWSATCTTARSSGSSRWR